MLAPLARRGATRFARAQGAVPLPHERSECGRPASESELAPFRGAKHRGPHRREARRPSDQIESTKNLNTIFLGILDEFRQRYLVSYSPQGVAKGGWHRLEVRIKNRKATVIARPGYLGGS